MRLPPGRRQFLATLVGAAGGALAPRRPPALVAHHFHPDRARATGFRPFWEFIAGPLHAGTFFNGALDPTFGPEARFRSVPPDMKPNRPPSEGLQFFGRGSIDAGSEVLTVSLHDREGRQLYSVDLLPER